MKFSLLSLLSISKIGICLFLLVFNLVGFSQENSVAGGCGDGIDNDGDGLVDCYDFDCYAESDCSNFFIGQSSNCTYIPPSPAPFDMKEEWRTDTTLYDIFSTLTPVAGDIDGDGLPEVIALSHNGAASGARAGNIIYVIDGSTGNVDLSITMPVDASFDNPSSSFAIADLDLDGFGEIVVLGIDGLIRCYEHNGLLKWTSGSISPFASVPGIADFNEDGFPELYGSNWIINGQTGAIIVAGSFPPNGIGAPLTYALAVIGMSVAVDVLPDTFCPDCAGLELVAGHQVFSVNIATGTLTTQTTASNSVDGFTAIADYDSDGDLDGIITTDRIAPITTGKVNVYVWDLQTPTVMYVSPDFIGTTFWGAGQANVGDFDSDGMLEIGFVYPGNYVVLDDYTTGMSTKWTRPVTDQSGATKSIIFDFQADGIQEVVYQDEDSLYVFDGNTGGILSSALCTGGTVVNHPIVIDSDGDDIAEIICVCSELTGQDPRLHGFVRSFGPDQSLWVDARSVWNQSSYFVVNVNDDLTIPTVLQDHSILGDSIVLNGFNIQSSILDTNFQVLFSVPDATIDIVNISTASCGGSTDSISFDLSISNLGDLSVIPASTIVSIYNGDPSLPGAILIASFPIGTNVPPFSNFTINVIIPDQGGAFSLYTVVNDNGLAAPLAGVTFPNSGISECDFTNNQDIEIVSCGIILPVTLQSFEAQLNSLGIIDLFWTTVSEFNNDYFVVQRSREGLLWEDIENVDGAGNSSTVINYISVDRNPFFGDNFYRLKQYDFNGEYSFSDVKHINNTFSNIRVYPNPTQGVVNIAFLAPLEDVTINVYNIIGELVDVRYSSSASSISFNIDCEDGIYFIDIVTNNQILEKTVVVKAP